MLISWPLGRILIRIALVILVLLFTVCVGAWWFLRSSLPQLDGEHRAPGLTAPATISRDAAGAPSIQVDNRGDGAYALGFLHAQDRFFQMDLLRRAAAGELAELLGAAVLEEDRSSRRFGFRQLAQTAVDKLPAVQRALLASYTRGANEGLLSLSARPFEYLVLGSAPAQWRDEDSLLVIWAMYLRLQGHIEARELARSLLRHQSSELQFAFLMPQSSRFDTPFDAAIVAEAPMPATAPTWVDGVAAQKLSALALRPAVGSNAWAIGGAQSAHGGAILANDMHLPLSLPNTWYRATLRYPSDKGLRQVVGLTLPGTPLFVAGSNGSVAWGFTNGFADTLDLVELEAAKDQPHRYRIAGAWEMAHVRNEKIMVRGGSPTTLRVVMTSAGPVREAGGRHYAVEWIARERSAVDLGLVALESAQSVETAMQVAAEAGIPSQNILLADSKGHIGWTLAGRLPQRAAPADTTVAQAAPGWNRVLPGALHPRLIDPPAGFLWSANSRQFNDARQNLIGDGGADIGARAGQIREGLATSRSIDERGVFALAMDDRATFMGLWRNMALSALTDEAVASHPPRAEFRALLRSNWSGHADTGSVGYTLSRFYLEALYMELFGAVDEKLAKLPGAPSFSTANPRWPAVVMRLLQERPLGWLKQRTWKDVELAALDRAIATVTEDGSALREARWGELNASSIGHPLQGVPLIGAWLRAPAQQQAGDDHMPRVAGPAFGQSERLVVSPGRENKALFNMPGGQSGHPMSPFFLAGHDAWNRGIAVPLLPGPEQHRLVLIPR